MMITTKTASFDLTPEGNLKIRCTRYDPYGALLNVCYGVKELTYVDEFIFSAGDAQALYGLLHHKLPFVEKTAEDKAKKERQEALARLKNQQAKISEEIKALEKANVG